MDQGAFLFSVCMMMICLLGTVRCPNSDNKSNCPCPEIPSTNQTEPPPRTCFQINSTYRYKCKGGYVRKAGTSNLIRCEEVNGVAKWSQLFLVCIPDPKIKTTTRKPNITVTMEPTDIPHQPVITTTDTASTSPQTNRGTHMSASVTAGTDRTEPASPDLSISTEHKQEMYVGWRTTAMDGTTSSSTTTEPANNSSVNSPAAITERSTTTALVTCASLMIICAMIGLGLVWYRRKLKSATPVRTAEEAMPMKQELSTLQS